MTTALTEHPELTTGAEKKDSLRVAYMLHRFPYLTETFIMREMFELKECNVDVRIYSLLPPKHKIVHAQAQSLLSVTTYAHFLSLPILAAQWYFLVRSPRRYFRSLCKAIWQTYREPGLLLRVMILFPKTVWFARHMQRSRIDHVHAHFAWLEGIAAGVVSDLTDIAFTIHPHAFGLFMRPSQEDIRRELQNATKVVTVSEYHRAYIADLCPQIDPRDIEVVHYGVDSDRFYPPQQKLGSDIVRIVSVGRLVEKKGHKYLIEACAELVRRDIPVQCSIVGEGPCRADLTAAIEQHQLQDHVTLTGAQSEDQILEWYQQSDLFAMACIRAASGDQDGMPNSLIEAMSCELPVVTTPVAGIPDLVVDCQNGLLVSPHSASQLAKALERLVRDKPLRQRLGREARQTVIEGFQPRQSALQLAKMFRCLCGRQASTSGNAVSRH